MAKPNATLMPDNVAPNIANLLAGTEGRIGQKKGG